MNASKTNKFRYWLSIMLDDMPEGEVFGPGRLHITLLPWFVLREGEEKIVESFKEVFSGFKPFDVSVGGSAFFGPKKDVAVNLINSEELKSLHKTSLEWFGQIGGRWAVKNPHVGDEFKAHVRRRQGTHLEVGEVISIKSISLIKAARHEDGNRVVAGRVDFDEA